METSQRQQILRLHPATTGRVFRLGEFAKFEIPDPYRESLEVFEGVLQLIQRGIDTWVPRIRALD